MKSKLSGVCIEAGVDWITVTAREPEKVEKLREIAFALIECEMGLENFGRPWFQSGYEGVSCGHVQYGERQDGCIVRLGSHVAASHWMRLLDHCDNVTRLDLQCTFRLKERPNLAIHRHYKELQRRRRTQKRAAKLAKICDDEGGYTVYTGRRVSNVLGRIYDKGSESQLRAYDGCVRYEVQFNGRRAKWVALATRLGCYTKRHIALSVLGFFTDRGACLRNLEESLNVAVSIDTTDKPAKKSDLQRKLEWLRKAVQPSVTHLMALGFSERVLSALGLQLPLFPVQISTA